MKRNVMGIAVLTCAAMLMAGSVTANAAPVAVYCFFQEENQDHFYTASDFEKKSLISFLDPKGMYTYMGTGWTVETTGGNGLSPVYRFYNDRTKDHFFTISEQEKQLIEQNYETRKDDYKYEGVAWYASSTSGIPVYRFFDQVLSDHYYTADEMEKNNLINSGNQNIRYEGIAWYGFSYGTGGGRFGEYTPVQSGDTSSHILAPHAPAHN